MVVVPPSTTVCRENPACAPASFCGDGWCDEEVNTLECGWDGGDCCVETCVNDETTDLICGSGGYTCKNGAYATPLSEECLSKPQLVPEFVGDGFCDKVGYYNSIECDFDGGDCCQDTCVGACPSFRCVRDLIPKGCQADLFFLGYVPL